MIVRVNLMVNKQFFRKMLNFYKNSHQKESGNLLIPLILLIALPIFVFLAFSKQSQDIRSKASENKASLSVTKEIPVDKGPLALAVNEEANKIYVGNNNGTDATTAGSSSGGKGNLAIIDGNSSQVEFLRNGAVIHPLGAAYNPQTHKLYITNNDNDEKGGWLTIIDTRNISQFKKTKVGGVPRGIAINKKTNKIYIANNDDPWRSVSVVDGNADQEIKKIPVPGIPADVAVDEELNRIYVTNWEEGKDQNQVVSIIDGNSDTVIKNVLLKAKESNHRVDGENNGVTPYSAAVNPVTHNVYVTGNSSTANGLSGYLHILDPEGNTKSYKTLGERASGIVYNPVSQRIFVSVIIKSAADYRVFVLKDNNDTLYEESQVRIPWLSDKSMAINTKTGELYVGILGDEKKVVVIQDTANSAPVTTNTNSNNNTDSASTQTNSISTANSAVTTNTSNTWNSEKCALYKNNNTLEADCVNYGAPEYPGWNMAKWCACAKRCVGRNAVYGNKEYNARNFPQCASLINSQ